MVNVQIVNVKKTKTYERTMREISCGEQCKLD